MVFGHEQKTLQKQSRNKEFRLVLQQNNEGSFLDFYIMIYVLFFGEENEFDLVFWRRNQFESDLE